jgi:hypothetical protein
MFLVYYLILFLMPAVLIAFKAPLRGLWVAPRKQGRLLWLWYLLPQVLVWACALGFLPWLDYWLFTWQPTKWCFRFSPEVGRLLACSNTDSFLIDELTAFILPLAVASWWFRRIEGLPGWIPRGIAVFLYWVHLEEIQYEPLSWLVGGFKPIHHVIRDLNGGWLFLQISIVVVGLCLLALAAWKVPRKEGLRGARATLADMTQFIRQASPPRTLHLIGGIVLANFSGVLIDMLGLMTENDKYWDMWQAVVYLMFWLVSGEYPLRGSGERNTSPSCNGRK